MPGDQLKQNVAIIQNGPPKDGDGYSGEQRWCTINGKLFHFVYINGMWKSQQFAKGGVPLDDQGFASELSLGTAEGTTQSSTTISELGVFDDIKIKGNIYDNTGNVISATHVIATPQTIHRPMMIIY